MQNAGSDNKRRAEDGAENAAPNQDIVPRVKRQFVAPQMIRKTAKGQGLGPGKSTASLLKTSNRGLQLPLPTRCAAAPQPVAPVPAAPAAAAECQYFKVLYAKRSNKARHCLDAR